MVRTTVIAITGSVGKTTTKECIAAVLATGAPTLKTRDNRNDGLGVPRTLLAMRPWHRYAVVEIGAGMPGQIRRLARLAKPHIAVVLKVARTHTDVYPDLDTTALEKGALIEALPSGGAAILNADDPRVRAMAARSPAAVSLFGSSDDCELVAEGARSSWPERLAFTARAGDDRFEVRTRLVGTHWVGSVLAALAVARTCGVPMSSALAAIADFAPFAGRMQPLVLPNGAVVMRDEENGSPDTLDAMMSVLRDARAERRVLVMGDVSDVKGNPRKRHRYVGRLAAEVADLAVFVGEHAHHAVRAAVAAGMNPARCHHTVDARDAAELLKRELRAGDLAFVKGRSTEHLSRIVFAQLGEIGCWTSSCRICSLCDLCPQLAPRFDFASALERAVAAANHDRVR